MTALASECPICYEAITKESGVTTLSCSHSYHLKCIAVWILKSETCPCCRKAVSEHEKITDLNTHISRATSGPPRINTERSPRWNEQAFVPQNEYTRIFQIAEELLQALES